MLQTILDWVQYIGTTPIIITFGAVYLAIIKIAKRLNKDKDEIVPLLDAIFDIPTKYQKKSQEYHKAKTEKYKALTNSDKEKERYKKYQKKQKEKKKKAQIESFRKLTSKLKSMYQKFRRKWIR